MNNYLQIFSILFFAAILSRCDKAPVYPETPEIEFKEMIRYGNGDSLKVTILFKDGDGDLGLGADQEGAPYNPFDYVKNGSGEFVEISDSPSNPPYNCWDYFIGEYNPDLPATQDDTILLDRNSNHFNYFIEYLIKQPDDSFVSFNFEHLICAAPHQRFPVLSTDKGPIEGELTFRIDMTEIALAEDPTIYPTYFFNKYVKFRIHIQDRAFNKSNVIETPEALINF